MTTPNTVLRFPRPPRARMDAATVDQARAVIADLVRALRQVAPDHPVLDSLGCFAGEVSHGA